MSENTEKAGMSGFKPFLFILGVLIAISLLLKLAMDFLF